MYLHISCRDVSNQISLIIQMATPDTTYRSSLEKASITASLKFIVWTPPVSCHSSFTFDDNRLHNECSQICFVLEKIFDESCLGYQTHYIGLVIDNRILLVFLPDSIRRRSPKGAFSFALTQASRPEISGISASFWLRNFSACILDV